VFHKHQRVLQGRINETHLLMVHEVEACYLEVTDNELNCVNVENLMLHNVLTCKILYQDYKVAKATLLVERLQFAAGIQCYLYIWKLMRLRKKLKILEDFKIFRE
jgi:hypothetical protein